MTSPASPHALTDRLAAVARGDHPPPERLFALLTERCNLACPSCNFAEKTWRPVPEMSDQAWLDLVEESRRLGVLRWYLTGGEIFVRRELALSLIESIKAKGLGGEATTNGTLFQPGDAERIVAAGWDVLTFSVDGPDDETNDWLRGVPGALRRIEKNLAAFLRARASQDLPHLTVSTVLSRRNLQHLPDLARWVIAQGITEWFVQPILPLSQAYAELQLRRADFPLVREATQQAAQLAEAAQLTHNLDTVVDEDFLGAGAGQTDEVLRQDVQQLPGAVLRTPCFVPFTHLIVYPGGELSTCWLKHYGPENSWGQISLAGFWASAPVEEERAIFRDGRCPAYCRVCCFGQVLLNRFFRALSFQAAGAHQAAMAAAHIGLKAAPRDPEFLALYWLSAAQLGRTPEVVGYLERQFPGRLYRQVLEEILDNLRRRKKAPVANWLAQALRPGSSSS